MNRTPSKTETAFGRTANIRNRPEARAFATQGIDLREIQVNRSNIVDRSNLFSSQRPGPVNNTAPFVTNDPTVLPVLENADTGVQKAGFGWVLPLLVLGGFIAAAKMKKKKKNNPKK